MRSIYLAPAQKGCDITLFSLFFLEMLKANYEKVAYFCPIVNDQEALGFVRDFFDLDITYEEMVLYDVEEAEALISKDENQLLEAIIQRYHILLETYDFVLVCGIAQEELNLFFEDINLLVAKNISSPIVSVIQQPEESEIDIDYHAILNSNNTHLATIIKDPIGKVSREYPLFCLEGLEEMARLSIAQLVAQTDAEFSVDGNIHKGIKDIRVAAMGVDNFVSYVRDDDLVIVGGDRSDIILSSLAVQASKAGANISALLLSGGFVPLHLKELVEGFADQIPILSVKEDTFSIAKKVAALKPKTRYMEKNEISKLLGRMERMIDKRFFLQKFRSFAGDTITPLMFKYKIFEKAKQSKKKIVLPELDDRILKAADIILNRGIVDILFVGNKEEFLYRANFIGADISKAEFIDQKNSPQLLETFGTKLYELRRAKGMTPEAAKELLLNNATYFATMLVAENKADGMVSGATHTTADTVRPALQIIKTNSDTPLVSSIFFMALDTKVLVFGDCAINKDPSAEELAIIAISSYESAKMFNIEPRIAMLSYSTGDSGNGVEVQKVREATEIVKQKRPEIAIDGPIQYDAAVDPVTAKQKLPDSKVAGNATVFIFPDLNAGNNTYKAVQRSAGAIAIGPILQGLKKPVNDLSRGCLVDDVVNTIAITAILAQGAK
jgi:phosphate acetyltransferase